MKESTNQEVSNYANLTVTRSVLNSSVSRFLDYSRLHRNQSVNKEPNNCCLSSYQFKNIRYIAIRMNRFTLI